MLINAQTREELRVAIVDGHTLEDFQVEVAERGSTRGNIYRGTIAKVEPSLNAAFIDYGAERHGFLPIQDVVEEAWYRQPKDKSKRPRIEDVLERGKPIIVQVVKEAEEQKGAALTTNLSLAGRYLVLTPFDPTRGISRKVEDDATRKSLKDQIKKLEVPDGCGIIVRTNALDQNKTALSRDLAALLRLWKRVGTEARQGKGVKLIYSDQDLILQALRDYLDTTVQEILVDDDSAFARAEEYLKAYLPRGGDRLIRYTDREPLFSRYGLEPQIDRIYDRRVFLPSGGSIVIDRTEALTAVDVNSGRSTGAASQEQTAVDTNLEAATEVARQLRLRDIGGLLVVDFIDMRANRNQRKVEKALKDAMKADKARFSVGRISSNGLLEINRQRIHQALSMRTHRTCPTCDGTGRVPGPEMAGLNLLRRIRARATTAPLAKVRIALHPDLAEAVQNQRRHELAQLEEEFDLRIELVASHRLNLREQELEWVKREASDNGRPALTPVVQPASVRVGEMPDGPDEDEDDEAATKPKRKRKRRSRKKAGGRGEDGQAPGARAPPTGVPPARPETPRNAADGGQAGERDEAGRERSRRRRRSDATGEPAGERPVRRRSRAARSEPRTGDAEAGDATVRAADTGDDAGGRRLGPSAHPPAAARRNARRRGGRRSRAGTVRTERWTLARKAATRHRRRTLLAVGRAPGAPAPAPARRAVPSPPGRRAAAGAPSERPAAEPADGQERPRRRRSRRSAGSADAAEPGGDGGTTATASAGDETPPRRTRSRESGDGGGDGESGASRPRRRRRRRPRRSAGDGGDGGGSDES